MAMQNSGFAFSHRTNNFATHQPVLYTAVQLSSGPVAEFGCGTGSTPLLHEFCARQGRPVVTFESDAQWKEFFPLPPWPYPPTGPPTLLGSNRFNCDIDIDFSRF